jgi:molybdopterin-containing oxidoreductase family membrane subunit
MEKKMEFSQIEGKSRGFKVGCGALIALSLWGALSFWSTFTEGHHITGMSNSVPWGLPITAVIFLIGVSAGSLVLSSLSAVFGKNEYKPFSRVSAYLAALLLAGAIALIVLDWGRPDRILLPFFHLNILSIFSWNGFLYTAYIGICVIYLWAMFAESKSLIKPIGILAVFWAILVHSGTGAIFGFITGRELYHSPLLPPSFVAAALSSGTALIILVLLVSFRFTKRELAPELIFGLSRLLFVFVIVVLYFLLVENLARLYSQKDEEAVRFLLFGSGYSLLFWGGLIVCGSLIPLLLLLKKSICAVSFASFLVLVGVFCERLLIVLPGQVLPQKILDVVESPFFDGEIANYSLSLSETGLVLGVFSGLALAFIFGLKVLPLLPREAKYED